jgi:hypothetical protein
MIERRAEERAIRKRRNEAANAMLRGQPPEQQTQERDAGGRFSAPPVTHMGMDGGSRGGAATRNGDWLQSQLRGDNN